MNTYIQEQEFNGNPEECTITPTSLDLLGIILNANDCLSNAANIARKYNFCTIVEGILWSIDREDGGMSFVRHAWNFDTCTKKYFDKTIGLDDAKNNTAGKFEHIYFKCYEYTFDYAIKHRKPCGFQYSYNGLIDSMKSSFIKCYYRPCWTCGRYNAEKHVAIMYNLLAGYSFFFESYSADVIGHILAVGRDGKVEINAISQETGIAIESLQSFFDTLYSKGLLTNHIYSEDEVMQLRHQLRDEKKSQQAWIDKPTQEKLPMDTSNAEQQYFDAVDNGNTICSVMFELTYRCSEMCIHCYNPGATRNDQEISHRGDLQELTLDDYKRIIDEMYNLGLVKVCLSGGDPFSNKNAWEIIDYLYQKEIAFDVFTNGQRITKDVKRLADYFPRLVGVSIYSGVAEDHDAITRIPGSWERSMQVVRELSDLAVPMNLKCCVMQPNLHTYYMVADLAKEYGAQPQFEINITESNDGDICAKQLRLTEEQLQVVLRDKNISLYVGKEKINYGGMTKTMDAKGCGAADTGFCMTPNGQIRPCCAFPLDFDNAKNGIKEIFQSPHLHTWRNAILQKYIDCGRFEYCAYCNLCPGNNYVEHGDFRKPAETNCYMAKVRYNLAQKLKENYISLSREQFVEALHKLPIEKVTMQRMYHTKG